MTQTDTKKAGVATLPRKIMDNQKTAIATKLKKYREEQGLSQDDIATASGVNKAYVNRIEKGEFEITHKTKKPTSIADNHFSAIARVVGYSDEVPLWAHFNTPNFVRIVAAFEEARKGDLRAIDGNTGMGKSYACRKYLQVNRGRTFLIRATDDLTVKGLVEEVASEVGVTERGNRTQMRKAIVQRLRGMDEPLLIFDEAENLSDNAWKAIKTFIDYLENEDVGSARRYLCGIVVLGMDIQSEIVRKAARRKGVYPQIKRRFAGSWRQLDEMDGAEIRDIALSFDISNAGAVRWLQRNVKDYDHLSRLVSGALRFTKRNATAITAEILDAIGQE